MPIRLYHDKTGPIAPPQTPLRRRLVVLGLKAVLLASIGLYGYTYFRSGDLPDRGEIRSELFREPVQEKIAEEKFELRRNGAIADIEPLYSYDIYGLVVEEYDSESLFDYVHKNDPFNTRDLCVIWGDNLKINPYQSVEYSHGEFTCYYKYRERGSFNHDELSNNHILPADDKIYAAVKKARVGDQIRAAGKLARYSVRPPQGSGYPRGTSITRTDSGNGACEVIYTEEFEVLHEGNAFMRLLNKLSLAAAALSFAALGYGFFSGIRRSSRPLSS
jgi:hypothetical protein